MVEWGSTGAGMGLESGRLCTWARSALSPGTAWSRCALQDQTHHMALGLLVRL